MTPASLGATSGTGAPATDGHDLTAEEDLTAGEIASHVVTGMVGPRAKPDGPPSSPTAPLQALEQAVRPALERCPCLVSFSGGHDSSLVLAIAVRVARREGLALPVPISWRFPDVPEADESVLQEDVLRSLGVGERIVLPAGDELDFVGPVARRVLARHGPLYPANAHLHAPLLERACGGTLLTGNGGDEILGRWGRPRRPWLLRHRPSAPDFPWMRPAAAARVTRALYVERRHMPRRAVARPRWQARRRSSVLKERALRTLAEDAGTAVASPLLDPGFLDALERCGLNAVDLGGRAGLLQGLFEDVVPAACLAPRPKARFGGVFWRTHTRSLTASFDGSGVDRSVVDPTALADVWRSEKPDISTALLVQQLWSSRAAAAPAAGLGGTNSG